MKTKKHRAEVIEVYKSEGKAAVKFSYNGHDRVECVKLYIGRDCLELTVGMKGWAAYAFLNNMGLWGFEPFKKSEAA